MCGSAMNEKVCPTPWPCKSAVKCAVLSFTEKAVSVAMVITSRAFSKISGNGRLVRDEK